MFREFKTTKVAESAKYAETTEHSADHEETLGQSSFRGFDLFFFRPSNSSNQNPTRVPYPCGFCKGGLGCPKPPSRRVYFIA
jgi:hypothetical protein